MLEDVQAADGAALYNKLEKARAERSAPAFCDDIVSPLLREVGEYWLTDAALIAREHLATATVSRVLAAVKPKDRARKAPLLFGAIPPERHLAGASMAAFVAEQCGFPAIVVGVGATVEEIASTAKHTGAAGVGMSVIYYDAEHTVRELAKALGTVPLWVGGGKAAPGPWTRVKSMREFAEMLYKL
jgi:methylmalonyl-CoA mutase cobalamin-binding subunit